MITTLEQIDALFSRLSAENQLRLIDHLSDLTEYGDELGEGLRKTAIAYGEAHGADEFDAEHIATQVAYMGSTHASWQAWAIKRDEYLRHALSWLAQADARVARGLAA